MAVGDTRTAGARLRVVAPAEVSEARHFDQLSDRERQGFLQLYRGEDPATVPLATGEVVVFTDYFRVER